MTTHNTGKRIPSGVPDGGQFTASAKNEASINLSETESTPSGYRSSDDPTAHAKAEALRDFATWWEDPANAGAIGEWSRENWLDKDESLLAFALHRRADQIASSAPTTATHPQAEALRDFATWWEDPANAGAIGELTWEHRSYRNEESLPAFAARSHADRIKAAHPRG